MTADLRGLTLKGCALAAALLLASGATAGNALAEEEAFTPIPIIKGMQLLPEGAEAPTFNVKDIEGNNYDFAEHYQAKAHMIVFWSIFCEPCREEMPIIEQVYNEYKEKEFDVLAVNLDGDPFLEGIRGYVKQYSYTFKVLLDALEGDTFKISDPYQVAGTPVLYLIDSQGKVHSGHLGRITLQELKDLVDGMLEKG